MENIKSEKDIQNFILDLEQKLKNDWHEIKESISPEENNNQFAIVKLYLNKVLDSANFKEIVVEVSISLLATYLAKVIFANRNQSFLAKAVMVFIEFMVMAEIEKRVIQNSEVA